MVGVQRKAATGFGEVRVLLQDGNQVIRLFPQGRAVCVGAGVIRVAEMDQIVRRRRQFAERIHDREGRSALVCQTAQGVLAGPPVADDGDPYLAVAARLQRERLLPVVLHEIRNAITLARPLGQMVHRVVLERPRPAIVELLILACTVDVTPFIAFHQRLRGERGGQCAKTAGRKWRRGGHCRHCIPDHLQFRQRIDLRAQFGWGVVQVVKQECQSTVAVPGFGGLLGHQGLNVGTGAEMLPLQFLEDAAQGIGQRFNGKHLAGRSGQQVRSEALGQQRQKSRTIVLSSRHNSPLAWMRSCSYCSFPSSTIIVIARHAAGTLARRGRVGPSVGCAKILA